MRAPSNRMWGRSSSMRFQQPRYWVRTSAAFCSGVLVKNALLRWVGGHEGAAKMSFSALLSADDRVVLGAAAPAREGIPAACKPHVLCPCSRAAGRNRQGATGQWRLTGCVSSSRAECSHANSQAGSAPERLCSTDAAPLVAHQLRGGQRCDGQPLKDVEQQLLGQQLLNQGQLTLQWVRQGERAYGAVLQAQCAPAAQSDAALRPHPLKNNCCTRRRPPAAPACAGAPHRAAAAPPAATSMACEVVVASIAAAIVTLLRGNSGGWAIAVLNTTSQQSRAAGIPVGLDVRYRIVGQLKVALHCHGRHAACADTEG